MSLLSRFCLLVLLATPLTVLAQPASAPQRPNILFIAVDDLRPELGCYGAGHMVTPALDRLAASGTVFERAYCNVAVCGASRASLMSGLRPTAERFVHYTARHDEQAPEVPGLAEHFRENGYHTISNGKVYHYAADTPESWSEPAWHPESGSRHFKIPQNAAINSSRQARGPAYEAAEVPDNAYHDGQLADKAVDDLYRLREMESPFFLAVGFIKPHLPFVAPARYWRLYDRREIDLADNPFFPLNAPEEAFYTWGEMRSYAFIPREGPVSDAMARTLRHGYYACTSYVDAQIGRIVDTLERLQMADNTIIVVWGDHGFQLGEHGFWCKHTNFEVASRVPLIIHDPRQPAGQRITRLVEFVDLYPTLCELAGLERPGHLAGDSMAPLLQDPESEWKDTLFTRYGRQESIRTERYRYTIHYREGEAVSDMLYDLVADPRENINIANLPGMEETVSELRQRLLEHVAARR